MEMETEMNVEQVMADIRATIGKPKDETALARHGRRAQQQALQQQATSWFADEVLPTLTGMTGWRYQPKGDRRPGYGYIIMCDGFAGQIDPLDHAHLFRCGRRKFDFVCVGMPYDRHENAVRVHLARNYSFDHSTDLEMTWLPQEWSWWYPGRTHICVAAPVGMIRAEASCA